MSKNLYETPVSELLVIRLEERLLTDSPYGRQDNAGGDRDQRIIDEEY